MGRALLCALAPKQRCVVSQNLSQIPFARFKHGTIEAQFQSQGVNGSRPISLQFSPNVGEPIRSRIDYAFRVFAAIYNHAVVADDEDGAAIRCFYGETPSSPAGQHFFYVPALYRENLFENGRRALAKHRYANEDVYLGFGTDASSGRPDWLGEIFLWLSSSQEISIAERDSAGRIPYSETIFGREGLSPRKPHAALLMAWMENALCNGNTKAEEALPKPPSPVPGVEHLVVCSHDIDFYFADRASSLARLIKNLVVAIVLYKDWSYFADNFKMLLQLLGGKRIGEYLPALLKAADGECDFRSTFFVVTRRAHRRDPNYRLEQIADHLLNAAKEGFTVGVHGSYRSVVEDGTLSEEAQVLSERIGGKLTGTRQHWLRFGEHAVLFGEIERAGLACDSTLGFSEVVGFRNGASFAFPPYDFVREKPHGFLEIPLVLMDGSLEATARGSRTAPQQLAEEVLGESRKRGWGGISVLWHNPIEPISVPAEINRVFWNCAKQQKVVREKWITVEQFLACCLERYQRAGLLERVRVDGERAAGAS